MPLSDELDLIERSKAGNTQTFGKLVVAHQGFAYAVAFRFIGNRAEAEDIVQEAFVKLWRNLAKYRQEVKLTTWLYKIIVNLCLDYLKSAERRRQQKQVDVTREPMIMDEASAEEKLDDREMLGVIIELAKNLTPKQQMVFVLRDLESLPVEEVCEITGMTPGAMKSNLYYARTKIREGLTRHYGETSKRNTL